MSPARSRLQVIRSIGEDGAWDAFVDNAEAGTLAHLSGWRAVLEDGLGHEYQALAAIDADGAWHGVLPLVRMRSRIFGHHLVSMPFLNDGGPIGAEAARSRLAEHAVQLAREGKVRSLELRNRLPLQGDSLGEARPKVTVHLPLPADAQDLWDDTFRAKLRSQIRRPMKEGMEIRFGLDQLEPFYEVFARNMRDLGTPVHSRHFFERIARTFAKATIFGVVYLGHTPTAAGCGFLWNGEFEITWASSVREFNRLSPNMLLYWGFMQEAIRGGATLFNFGRCTPDGSTHRFKLQWGGEDVPLPWAQFPPPPAAPGGAESRSLVDYATRVWQRLPLGLTNRAGPLLARQIPWF